MVCHNSQVNGHVLQGRPLDMETGSSGIEISLLLRPSVFWALNAHFICWVLLSRPPPWQYLFGPEGGLISVQTLHTENSIFSALILC